MSRLPNRRGRAAADHPTELRTALRTHDGNPLARMGEVANEIERSAAAAARRSPPAGVARVQVEERVLDVRGWLWTGSKSALGLLSEIVLLVFLVYFLLASGDRYRRKLVAAAGPSLARRRVTLEVTDQIGEGIQRYLVVLTLANGVVAVASWVAFRCLGVEKAAALGVLAGVFHSIPYLGALMISGVVALITFLQFGTLTSAATAVALELLISGLVGFLLIPWLVGRAARLNEVAVFAGLLFWGWAWGAVGLLVAVPMLVVLKSICDRVEDLRPIGELLGA